jgi:molybdate transport system substrate-binding protein
MRRHFLGLIAGFTLCAPIALAAPRPPAAPVDVFAAASLKEAVDEAGAAFEARTGHKVRATYASSAQIARQIEQGAPADVFISADTEWMDWAGARGLTDIGTRRLVAANDLVLIAPKDSAVRPLRIGRTLDLSRLLGGGRLAVGEVKSVPAGKYAKAALTGLGAWDGVKDHLAEAESVRAALAFVARGEAPLGIVYATDALAEPKVKVIARFPEGSHPPILYPAAVVKAAREKAGGEAFVQFLASGRGQAILRRHGFKPPPR